MRYQLRRRGTIEYKKHDIGINDEGKFIVVDMDIEGDTLEEVKKKIRESETKKAKMPSQNVWFMERWGGEEIIMGHSTCVGVGYDGQQVWVTWQGKNGVKREQKGRDVVYMDTPENRAAITQMNILKERMRKLQEQYNHLHGELKTIQLVTVEE